LSAEDEDIILFQNVGIWLPVGATSYGRWAECP